MLFFFLLLFLIEKLGGKEELIINGELMKRILLLLILVGCSAVYSQNRIEYFPDDLNIQPFTANILEPKLGFLFQTGKNELRMDIGNSIDIIKFTKDDSETFTFGADLFTYTLLRGESEFHFPVDAVDYLFGFNFGYKKLLNKNTEYGARLRISHISAHFVDGHFDGTSNKWKDNRNPIVYSREFFELMPYYKINTLRFYAGITYLLNVTPNTIGKDNYQLGFDYFYNEKVFDLFTPFAAYDFKLGNTGKITPNHSLMLGIKFGKVNGKGFSVYYNYYSGKSIHGEYYDVDKEYSAFGINLDL